MATHIQTKEQHPNAWRYGLRSGICKMLSQICPHALVTRTSSDVVHSGLIACDSCRLCLDTIKDGSVDHHGAIADMFHCGRTEFGITALVRQRNTAEDKANRWLALSN